MISYEGKLTRRTPRSRPLLPAQGLTTRGGV